MMREYDNDQYPAAPGERHGYTIVLTSERRPDSGAHRDTDIPLAGTAFRPMREEIPGQLRALRRMFEYGRGNTSDRAKNFYRQAVFMKDYEDDFPWKGEYIRFFPTYQDMTVQQLRGYFTWRAQLRNGDYKPIATSAAYIYLYELLNGIGADSPEEVLIRLKEFEEGYLDSGIGNVSMKRNLHRWMLEYSVLNDLPAEIAAEAADAEMMERDRAIFVLSSPEDHPDEALFEALSFFARKKLTGSPVILNDPGRGKHLVCEAWRFACRDTFQGEDLCTRCFGRMTTRGWYPLSNAVYYERAEHRDRDYALNECRTYRCRDGIWQEISYEKLSYDRDLFMGFVHETDAKLRRYLRTGRYLREKPADAWAVPYIEAAAEADERAQTEAARPEVKIDLAGLDRIRQDAAVTRDSLLTEEEAEEQAPDIRSSEPPRQAERSDGPVEAFSDLPLDRMQTEILRRLVEGDDAAEIIKENHLMPSVTADELNEALFDEIGDAALICKDDRLYIMEDYIEDIERLLGGNINER